MFLHGTGATLQFTPLCHISSHLQNSKFRDSTFFFSWRKRNTFADAERTPSSTASIQILLMMLRHRVAKNGLLCVCSDKWTFFVTSTRSLLMWRLVILNQIVLEILLLWSSGRNGNKKKKKCQRIWTLVLFWTHQIRWCANWMQCVRVFVSKCVKMTP